MTITTRIAGLSLLAVSALGVAGCGGSSSGGAAATSPFNDQGAKTLTCMTHQSAAPVAIDHPGSAEDPESVLSYLRYYTANGNKPYCDGKPATATDRQWLALYEAGGAAKSNIAKALSASG